MHRDELDQRIPLDGDLAVFDEVTKNQPGEGQKYDHLTFSWDESSVSDEMLEKAVQELKTHALLAWPQEDRHRVAFYAEAHRPRILSYTNKETGEEVGRCTHIHVGIGRHDLLTGKAIDVLGYLGSDKAGNESPNLKYIDAWQESFNARYGFSSPKDNPKITPENAVDILARYTGQRPDEHGSFNKRKASVEVDLQNAILKKNIESWSQFEDLLKTCGAVRPMNKGAPNESFRIEPKDGGRAMRLKGVFFSRQFIERPTAEKLKIIQDKARTAYLEQMQPRKESAYVAGVLEEWQQLKARENRYLHTGSAIYRDTYKPADLAGKLEILENLEKEHHGPQSKPKSVITHDHLRSTTTRTGLRRMPVRNLDAIQRRSEMLLRGDTSVDVGDDDGQNKNRAGLRPADEGDARARKQRLAQASLTQPSSVIAGLQVGLKERYEQASDKEKYAEIRNHLDCDVLLLQLKASHGITPDSYQIKSAKDGSPRIQCGSRSLFPNDFLTKELGLPWREAAPILRTVYQIQLGIKVIPQKTSKELFAEYNKVKVLLKARRDATGTQLKAKQKFEREAVYKELRIQRQAALADDWRGNGNKRNVRSSLIAVNQVADKAKLREQQADERLALYTLYAPPPYAEWKAALTVPCVTGKLVLEDEEEKKLRLQHAQEHARKLSTKLLELTAEETKNGYVIYRSAGVEMFRDEGRHLAVLEPNSDEAIALALAVAQQKFGKTLILTGDLDFQQRVVAVAVARGIGVEFADKKLEEYRRGLKQNQSTQARLARIAKKPSIQSNAVPAVAPAVDLQQQKPEKTLEKEPDREAEQPPPPTEPTAFDKKAKNLREASPIEMKLGTPEYTQGVRAIYHLGRGEYVVGPAEAAVEKIGKESGKEKER
ncbi:MAG: LPD7 domain-containing protein [Betaproteobacteria bacterium]